MRIGKLAAVLAVAAAFISTTCAESLAGAPIAAKDTGPIIGSVIAAYGGKDAIKAVKSSYVKADLTADIRGDSGTYVRYLERPDRLRVEINYRRSSELRILNGKEGWRGLNENRVKKVENFQYLSMLYQYKQIEIPYALATGGYKVRWVGEALVGGRRAEILSLGDDDGVPIDLYVDSGNGLILKTAGYFNVNGNNVDLTAEFSDYRKVNGTMMPFVITNYSQGMKIGVTTVKECRVNVPMKAGLFRP